MKGILIKIKNLLKTQDLMMSLWVKRTRACIDPHPGVFYEKL